MYYSSDNKPNKPTDEKLTQVIKYCYYVQRYQIIA